MAKVTRVTQKLFGSTPGTNQIGVFGSLKAGTPTYSTDPATIMGLSNWLVGWYQAVIGNNSPAIQDLNSYCYVMAYQMAYALQQGVAEWDSGTTYYLGSIVNIPQVNFTVTSANATAGATYSNNGNTFTVLSTIAGSTLLQCQGTGVPAASGTLTKLTGTGDATITFSTSTKRASLYASITDSNTNNYVTDTANWLLINNPMIAAGDLIHGGTGGAMTRLGLGTAFQRLQVNSGATDVAYSYATINEQSISTDLTVPSGYNYMAGYITIPNGRSHTVAGSAIYFGPMTIATGGTLTITGTVEFK